MKKEKLRAITKIRIIILIFRALNALFTFFPDYFGDINCHSNNQALKFLDGKAKISKQSVKYDCPQETEWNGMEGVRD